MWVIRVGTLALGIAMILGSAVTGQESGASEAGPPEEETGELDPEQLQMLLEALVERAMDSDREAFFEEVLRVSGNPLTTILMTQVAFRLYDQGNYREAQELNEKAVESAEQMWGVDHPGTLALMNNLASVLEAQNDLSAARDLHERVLELSRPLLGDEHPDTLTSMTNLASVLEAQGDLSAARDLHEQVLEVRRRLLGEDHLETLVSMSSLALILKAEGSFAVARELLEHVLEVCRRLLGDEHPDTLTSISNLAQTLHAQGDLAEARQLHQQVLEVRRRVLGKEHRDTLTSMSSLAQTLHAQGDLAEARQLHQQVLEVRRRVLGKEHRDTLTSMSSLAQTLHAQDDLARAQELHEQVVEVSRRRLGEEHRDTLTSKSNLALTFHAQGNLTAAMELLEQVLEVRRRLLGVEHLDTVTSMNNLAQSFYARGDLIAARKLFGQVLAVSRSRLGEEHRDTLTSMSNLALTIKAEGDLAAARELEEKVLEVRRRLLGEDHPDTLLSKSNLAQTLHYQGDLTAARELSEQVLAMSRRRLGEDHAYTLTSMNNLAETLRAQSDLTAARKVQEKVLEIRRRLLGEDHPDTLLSMNNLASTLQDQSDLAAAKELLNRALEVSRGRFGKEHPHTLRLMNNLAVSLYTQGDHAGARLLCKEVIAILGDLAPPGHRPNTHEEALAFSNLAAVHRTAGNLKEARLSYSHSLEAIETLTQNADISEEVKSRFRSQYGGHYRGAIATTIALERQEEAFHIAERFRALNLLIQLSDKNLAQLSVIPPEVEERRNAIAKRLDSILRELDHMASAAQPDKDRIGQLAREQAQLRRKRDVLYDSIRQAARGDDWQLPKPLSIEEIRQSLDPGTLLTSYMMVEDGFYIFLISKQTGLEIRHAPVKHPELGLQVLNLFRQIQEAKSSNARNLTAGWLYKKLIKPIADRVETSDRLLILPDGPLHFLPFAALTRPTGKGWQYLVEWKPFHVAASATVYAELRKKRTDRAPTGTKTWDLVAFGDPIYPQPEVNGGLKPLPYTHRELTEIGRLFSEDAIQIHLREDALEEHAMRDAPRGRILHFATHSSADPRYPAESFLGLTIPEVESENNGLLQAWEIRQRLRLQADLVVLSACQTALGDDYGGEGLMSLSRTFQIAGARTVVASLWNVNDVSTAELMIRFYRHLKEDGMSKDEALQAAQLDLIRGPIETVDENGKPTIRDFSAPYYWAAFQVIGDRL